MPLGGEIWGLELPSAVRLADSLQPFVANGAKDEKPCLRLSLHVCEERLPEAEELQIETDEDGYRFRYGHGWMTANRSLTDFMAYVPDLAEVEFDGRPWLMLALWAHLSLSGGALLHGGLCLFEKKTIALLGPKQRGKTTACRLMEEAGGRCFNDEHIFVTTEGSRIEAHNCPWRGQLGVSQPWTAPLAAIFLLRQAEQHEAIRLSSGAALRGLIASTFFLPALPDSVPQTLAVLGQMATRLPIYDLGFRRDSGLADVIRNVL